MRIVRDYPPNIDKHRREFVVGHKATRAEWEALMERR